MAAATLASFVESLRYDDVPKCVVDAAKYHLLDVIGCGLAALGLDEGSAGTTVARASAGTAEATVLGLPERLPAPQAALANGMRMHALDFDDTHERSIAHISTVVAPAAMAQAEAVRSSGREFLTALITGNEIVARVGMAAPGAFHARGFHPTSVAGVFGSTACAAQLARLPRDRAASALGIAGSMSSGLFAYLDSGTATKPIHAGWAAHAGIVAARLAQAGAEGPPGILEGRFGVFDAFTGRVPDLSAELSDLGTRWETPNIAFKAYPACHYIHGVLGAAEQLGSIDPDDITDILVTVPDGAVPLVLEPLELKFAPRTPYDARFSLPYSLAALLVHREINAGTYRPDAIADPEVLAISRRVRYEVCDFPSYPGAFPGAVEITLRDRDPLSAEIAHQPGGPANPLRDEDIEAKFRANASLVLDPSAVAKLQRTILAIDEADSLSVVFRPLGAARADGFGRGTSAQAGDPP